MSRPALVVGLTGGAAAGKSAITRRFEALGVPVHDADIAAREVVPAGTDGLGEIVARFGDGVLDSAGALDRGAMRERVFADPAAHTALEAIVHPRVRQWLLDRVQSSHGNYCVLAIPLLVENLAHYRWVDRILVVDAPESLQLTRLMARDGIAANLARRMLAQQIGRAERLAAADDVIDNTGDEEALTAAVTALHLRYLALAMEHQRKR
ncbi:MAG: dephospho-CoA kinase [Rhodanobacter sp.]